MKTIAIIPGFAEGDWHGRQLRQELTSRGYKVIHEAADADVILTHSAGCYLIPEKHHAHTVLVIGPPYWPGRPILMGLGKKVWRDMRANVREKHLGHWVIKSFWNFIYALGSFRLVGASLFASRRHNWSRILAHKRVIIVRNQADPFSPPHLHELLKMKGDSTFVELPGEHDDLWLHPGVYVDLLQSKV